MASIKKTVFSIIRKPRITEKAAHLSADANCVVFEVHPDANKLEIKKAIEKIFECKVANVRTVNMKGDKRKSKTSKHGGWKKAYISLAEGSTIDLIEGL